MAHALPQNAYCLPLSLACEALCIFGWLTFVSGAGDKDTATALVFPPSWSARDVFVTSAQLDVDIIGFGPASNILIVRPHSSNIVAQAQSFGALLALSSSFVTLCGVSL